MCLKEREGGPQWDNYPILNLQFFFKESEEEAGIRMQKDADAWVLRPGAFVPQVPMKYVFIRVYHENHHFLRITGHVYPHARSA